MKLGSAYLTAVLRFRSRATAAGARETRTTLAPTPPIVPRLRPTPATFSAAERWAALVPDLNLTMTVCASYDAADALAANASSETAAAATSAATRENDIGATS